MKPDTRKIAVHAARVAMLVCILWLMRAHHRDLLKRPADSSVDLVSVRQLFPIADSLSPTTDRHRVLDVDHQTVGYVLQTSPMCDHIVGFSGPTNVMLALSSDNEIVGAQIVSSGDTRDHIRQINKHQFLQSFHGLDLDDVPTAKIDAVSGATLTSLAIRESIALRLGDSNRGTASVSLRFPNPIELKIVRQLFPAAEQVRSSGDHRTFEIKDANGQPLGTVLRISPAADNIIGYQGPTDAVIGFTLDGIVVGLALNKSFDNEPYVGYVREDAYFTSLFNGLNLTQLASVDVAEAEFEGVSGATMTSMSVFEGITLAAKNHAEKSIIKSADDGRNGLQAGLQLLAGLSLHDWGTIACVLIGSCIGLTRLRANRGLAVAWKVALIGYMGFVAGSLLSQAMIVGWARNGIPFENATGLVCLAFAAFTIPIFTKRNIYCSHLCPHGAAQHILKRKVRWQWKVPGTLKKMLRLIPAVLLLWCVWIGMTSWGFSLVDIEPFDAYLFRIAGWATLAIACLGLVASLFVPMAYCRYGCPTGALLNFVRFHAKADRWTGQDSMAAVALLLAVMIRFRA